MSPLALLEGRGFRVSRDGQRHWRAERGGEEYRLTLNKEGHWLWCDKSGSRGGDTIDLVREIEPGTGYAEAVRMLLGLPSVGVQAVPAVQQQVPSVQQLPQLPVQRLQDCLRGRAYLAARGISQETILHAERTGMLRYAPGAILFVGYDSDGTPRCVTRRATDPADPVQKRDLRGSAKGYPPILPGDPSEVWIVEGGVDALALHDLARRHGMPTPTVLISGGASTLAFLEQPWVQDLLRRAKRVVVAKDREKDAATQARTDTWHQRQAQRVEELTGRKVRMWMPQSEHVKDLADLNLRQREQQAQAAQEGVEEPEEPVDIDRPTG